VDFFFGWSQFLFLIWKRNYGEWVEIRVSREACPRRFEKYAKKYPWDICDFFQFTSLHSLSMKIAKLNQTALTYVTTARIL